MRHGRRQTAQVSASGRFIARFHAVKLTQFRTPDLENASTSKVVPHPSHLDLSTFWASSLRIKKERNI